MEKVIIERVVQKKHLADAMKSGSLPVLATPQMIAWMEEAACLCLDLEEGKSSVGIHMDVSHDAPSALNSTISIHAEVIEQNERIIKYNVSAYQGKTCIGKGIHTRCIIKTDSFMQKLK